MDLKPRPFCGSTDLKILTALSDMFVKCNTCHCEGPFHAGSSHEASQNDNLRLWNTRKEIDK